METKEMKNCLLAIAGKTRQDNKQVFNDALKYIVGSFNPTPKPDPSWHYTKEQNVEFFRFLQAWLVAMQDALQYSEWADPWGDLFMSLNVGGNNKGQFFTPDSLCNLMAEIAATNNVVSSVQKCGTFGERLTVCDPACGSGRNLLAAHALLTRGGKRKPYVIAEDIDINCCRMTAINLMVHGCFGEVVCHDVLTEPDSLVTGFIINEGMYPFSPGLPTIRETDNPCHFVSLRKRGGR